MLRRVSRVAKVMGETTAPPRGFTPVRFALVKAPAAMAGLAKLPSRAPPEVMVSSTFPCREPLTATSLVTVPPLRWSGHGAPGQSAGNVQGRCRSSRSDRSWWSPAHSGVRRGSSTGGFRTSGSMLAASRSSRTSRSEAHVVGRRPRRPLVFGPLLTAPDALVRYRSLRWITPSLHPLVTAAYSCSGKLAGRWVDGAAGSPGPRYMARRPRVLLDRNSMGNSFFQAKVTSPVVRHRPRLRSGARAGSRRAGPTGVVMATVCFRGLAPI